MKISHKDIGKLVKVVGHPIWDEVGGAWVIGVGDENWYEYADDEFYWHSTHFDMVDSGTLGTIIDYAKLPNVFLPYAKVLLPQTKRKEIDPYMFPGKLNKTVFPGGLYWIKGDYLIEVDDDPDSLPYKNPDLVKTSLTHNPFEKLIK